MPELKHNLRVEPYPYQRDGILFGLEKKRLIIGDELANLFMGYD